MEIFLDYFVEIALAAIILLLAFIGRLLVMILDRIPELSYGHQMEIANQLTAFRVSVLQRLDKAGLEQTLDERIGQD